MVPLSPGNRLLRQNAAHGRLIWRLKRDTDAVVRPRDAGAAAWGPARISRGAALSLPSALRRDSSDLSAGSRFRPRRCPWPPAVHTGRPPTPPTRTAAPRLSAGSTACAVACISPIPTWQHAPRPVTKPPSPPRNRPARHAWRASSPPGRAAAATPGLPPRPRPSPCRGAGRSDGRGQAVAAAARRLGGAWLPCVGAFGPGGRSNWFAADDDAPVGRSCRVCPRCPHRRPLAAISHDVQFLCDPDHPGWCSVPASVYRTHGNWAWLQAYLVPVRRSPERWE